MSYQYRCYFRLRRSSVSLFVVYVPNNLNQPFSFRARLILPAKSDSLPQRRRAMKRACTPPRTFTDDRGIMIDLRLDNFPRSTNMLDA